MRILVIEDNLHLSDAIAGCVAGNGVDISRVHTGEDALRAVEDSAYDILILDLGLPDMDGLSVLRQIRERHNTVPVLVLTARDSMSDRVHGFNSGADDYMTKPFAPSELAQRVHALTQAASSPEGIVVVNDLSFDTTNRMTKVRDVALSLSEQETEVLEQLLLRRGKLVPAGTLQHRLEDRNAATPSASVEALVTRLRDKLRTHDAQIEIHTLKGIGYMLDAAHPVVFNKN